MPNKRQRFTVQVKLGNNLEFGFKVVMILNLDL